jgi:hypothetical protein
MLKASSTERYRSSVPNGSSANGQSRSLAAEPMPSQGSMVSTEPRA